MVGIRNGTGVVFVGALISFSYIVGGCVVCIKYLQTQVTPTTSDFMAVRSTSLFENQPSSLRTNIRFEI